MHLSDLAGAWRHTLPVKAKVHLDTLRPAASTHRISGTTLVVGTGVAVCPVTLCLSARLLMDRSDDHISLRRFKVFPSLAGLV